MDRPEEIGVIQVADHGELGASGRKEEESFVDKETKIFDTILLGEAVEAARGKLKVLKDQGRDTCGVFKYFFHLFSVNENPLSHAPIC